MKTNLTHNNVTAALVFFQLANRSGTEASATAVNYKKAAVDDNSLVHYYKDSYKINSERCFVELGGV